MKHAAKNAPSGAHYYNDDNGQYLRVEGDIVFEWRANHWEISDLSIDLVDLLLSFDGLQPLYMGLGRDFLVLIFKIFMIMVGVGAFISLVH